MLCNLKANRTCSNNAAAGIFVLKQVDRSCTLGRILCILVAVSKIVCLSVSTITVLNYTKVLLSQPSEWTWESLSICVYHKWEIEMIYYVYTLTFQYGFPGVPFGFPAPTSDCFSSLLFRRRLLRPPAEKRARPPQPPPKGPRASPSSPVICQSSDPSTSAFPTARQQRE